MTMHTAESSQEKGGLVIPTEMGVAAKATMLTETGLSQEDTHSWGIPLLRDPRVTVSTGQDGHQ